MCQCECETRPELSGNSFVVVPKSQADLYLDKVKVSANSVLIIYDDSAGETSESVMKGFALYKPTGKYY